MVKSINNGIRMILIMTILLGVVYPLSMTGLTGIVFPSQSKGSLIEVNGKIVGSTLIGQQFINPEYFHGRPSAAGEEGYNAAASSGSNLGPTSSKLIENVETRIENVRKVNRLSDNQPIPSDLVMASSSGLDPHISLASAKIQAERIATVRDIPVEKVHELINNNTEKPLLGVFGQEKVNVLMLNLSLDGMVE